MLLPQSLTSRALAPKQGDPLSFVVRGGAVLAFDGGLIKGCETLSVTQAAEWPLMGDMHA